MTEELARRFCELVGWEPYKWSRNEVFKTGAESQTFCGELRGWAGVGIVVDEMRLRGFLWQVGDMSPFPDEPFVATVWAPNTSGHWRRAKQPLAAVLAASVAALEAEGVR